MRSQRLHTKAILVASTLGLLAAGLVARAQDKNAHPPSNVPIEVQPTDQSLAKIVLVAGRASHGSGEHEFFAGCAVLMKLLKENPGVAPVIARDGWPKDPRTFDNAKAVVFYMDGGGG